ILVAAQGWRHALVSLAAIVAVIAIPIHVILLRRWPADLGLHPDGDDYYPQIAVRTTDRPNDQRQRILRSASFQWIVLSLVTSTAGKIAISLTLVVYLTHRGYSIVQATVLAGGIGVVQVFGRVLTVWLRAHIAEHRIIIALFTAQGLALPIPLLTHGHGPLATSTVVVLVVFFGLAFGLPELMRGTLVADYYGAGAYASINGIL